ncbi:nuclease-related domain-containing protein [Acinetobacter sp. ANC 4648]|uniref:nuclease-related domain-containing protein n=1 Tax=Acinetobacter sp. ANC 4648 TaxID=1977875 RepID=UPI000A32C29B|nr:nuclease-related domain-containing protein [Acinetobacter sp. ANC 4648]OTG79803.1 NERD nuclease [Acinetobacter sp. ANC 4648]
MSQIISAIMPLFWMVIVFSIIFTCIRVFKSKIKGKVGEFAVKVQISKYLDSRYIDLHDLTFNDDQGTTQIDHVLISPFGIFVIETKNYTGWIFGSERQKTWTQKIYKQAYKFQNPLHQNYRHVKAIEKILEDVIEPEMIHSFVIFHQGCEFKTEIPKRVFIGRDWINYVKQFDQQILTETKLKRIQLKLEKEALVRSFQTDRQHVRNLKNQHSEVSQ